MKKIGIITFHSAYNYGSVFQALATQEVIKKMGYTPEIINYRLDEQKKIYSSIRFKYGWKELVKDLTMLPIYNKRSIKYKKFEKFFSDYFKLSRKCSTPEQVSKIWSRYDTAVSGSDQIWNKHSLELEAIDWKYMNPYLLSGFSGKKISYASSTANMTDDELDIIKPQLDDFSFISMRESSSAVKISELLGKEIASVVDPTFLLKKEDWIKLLNLKKKSENYILYYSLCGLKRFNKIKKDLERVSAKKKCKILVVTPFCYVKNNEYFEAHPEFGPVEFLEALYNAKMVITDSYHGTILSVNFGKDVYSICKEGGSEFRKTDILSDIALSERIVFDTKKISSDKFEPINYEEVYSKLEIKRNLSLDYLKSALGK